MHYMFKGQTWRYISEEIEEASSQRRVPQCARRAWNYYFSFVWPAAYRILVP